MNGRTRSGEDVPAGLVGRVTTPTQDPAELVEELAGRGSEHVNIDGGRLIQCFLRAGLVDRRTLTRLPILLGDGIPLFGGLGSDIHLERLSTKSFPSGLVQSEYRIPRHTR